MVFNTVRVVCLSSTFCFAFHFKNHVIKFTVVITFFGGCTPQYMEREPPVRERFFLNVRKSKKYFNRLLKKFQSLG